MVIVFVFLIERQLDISREANKLFLKYIYIYLYSCKTLPSNISEPQAKTSTCMCRTYKHSQLHLDKQSGKFNSRQDGAQQVIYYIVLIECVIFVVENFISLFDILTSKTKK